MNANYSAEDVDRFWSTELDRLVHDASDLAEPTEQPKGTFMTTSVRPASLLLGTSNPDRLRSFYETALGGLPDGGAMRFDDFLLVIDQRDDVADATTEPGRFILNFHVTDFAAAEARLRSSNVTWIAEPEDRPIGRFGTFADPDGNYGQIVTFNVERPDSDV